MCAVRMRKYSGRGPRALCGEPQSLARAFEIRPCRREDLREAQKILAASPEAAEWSLGGLEESLAGYPALNLLAWHGEEIVGFASARRVLDEGEILNLAVKQPSRRRGAGRALVEVLLQALVRQGVVRVFLEVRESNLAAIAFYKNLGFQVVRRRNGYYRQPDEAALEMALVPPQPPNLC